MSNPATLASLLPSHRIDLQLTGLLKPEHYGSNTTQPLGIEVFNQGCVGRHASPSRVQLRHEGQVALEIKSRKLCPSARLEPDREASQRTMQIGVSNASLQLRQARL